MTTAKPIVVPTDFSQRSEAALPWAQRMAQQSGGEIHLLYVLEEPQLYAALDMGPVTAPSVDELKRLAQKRLAEFATAHRQVVGPAKQTVAVGRASREITAYAKDVGASMIVMTTHGFTGLKHALLGSTAEEVLRHAACPVLSIRSG